MKIGIMGCFVNGLGEMADADYGYVGAARGKISLYRGKQCVEMNIPEQQAVEKLLEQINKLLLSAKSFRFILRTFIWRTAAIVIKSNYYASVALNLPYKGLNI